MRISSAFYVQINILKFCENSYILYEYIVKLREREGQRVDSGRSFIDCRWWMVDILSLMLYTKFGCNHIADCSTVLLNGAVGYMHEALLHRKYHYPQD